MAEGMRSQDQDPDARKDRLIECLHLNSGLGVRGSQAETVFVRTNLSKVLQSSSVRVLGKVSRSYLSSPQLHRSCIFHLPSGSCRGDDDVEIHPLIG